MEHIDSTSSGLRSLISRCIAADPEAREEFVRQFYSFVERATRQNFALYGVLDLYQPEINDICNEVFVKLLYSEPSKLSQLKNPHAINAWLVTIARNHALNHIQRRSRELGRQLPLERAAEQHSQYPAPDEHTLRLENQLMVREMLAKLSDTDKLVLDLYYLHYKSYIEIAAILSSSTQTVGSRISRARKKLLAFFPEGHG